MARRTAIFAAFSLGALSWPAAAGAHITIVDPIAEGGATTAAFFRVAHGCGASPTVALRIEIAAEVASVKPQPKAGWTVEIETKPGAGGSARRAVAVTWRGRLEPDQFDQFGLLVRLPARAGPIYFPAVQTCMTGENRWVDIPVAGAAWTSVPHPAPVITLTGVGPAHEHDGG